MLAGPAIKITSVTSDGCTHERVYMLPSGGHGYEQQQYCEWAVGNFLALTLTGFTDALDFEGWEESEPLMLVNPNRSGITLDGLQVEYIVWHEE